MVDRVRVVYVGLLRGSLGIPEEEVELPAGSRVRELLSLLVEKHGADFQNSLFRSNGDLRPLIRVFIGDDGIEELNGLDTEVDARSGVYILLRAHPTSGG